MKYKVGDKVRIKSLDWYGKYANKNGIIVCGNYYFTQNMLKYCGKVLMITNIIRDFYVCKDINYQFSDEMIEGLVEEETKPKDMGEISDGYHTFNELYEYRMLYNAALFNEFAKQELYDVHKSRKHSDGEYPFGDSNWFIVMAELPTGQISNHYEMKDWDKFQIPEKPLANKWDEHSPKDVTDRLTSFTTPKKEYPKTYEECCEIVGGLADYVWGGYKQDLFQTFHMLYICREAYWKLYGEEIGLDKPWEPDWSDCENIKYIIGGYGGEIDKGQNLNIHITFAFPTEEMRDAFYENFKKEIEQCKELL